MQTQLKPFIGITTFPVRTVLRSMETEFLPFQLDFYVSIAVQDRLAKLTLTDISSARLQSLPPGSADGHGGVYQGYEAGWCGSRCAQRSGGDRKLVVACRCESGPG